MCKKKYDYIIVGAGLSGATFAYLANSIGKKCLVIDKREHKGGNTYIEKIKDINTHKYGPHIFHTNSEKVWHFINLFVKPQEFHLTTMASYKDKLYNLPFNMNTFYQMWGIKTPKEVIKKIESQKNNIKEPKNLEEQAISLVGTDIYNTLIKNYTEKQWGKKCTELPSFIIKRLPVRFTFNNDYFNDKYECIFDYNELIEKLLKNIPVKLNTNFKNNQKEYEEIVDKIIYTGPIDEYYDYKYGYLEYRSLEWKTFILNESNYQGTTIVNYTDESPWTRIIEHKHFDNQNIDIYEYPYTIISKEFSQKWDITKERYYPINDEKNNQLYEKYKSIENDKVIFLGRLGEYKYYDMDDVIERILNYFYI